MIPVGLRVDVDTLRGTRIGVPNLTALLKKHNIHASFFFSLGPDNMGRHIWRLLRPQFLIKMMRTKAASLYGWDILLRGLFWPGPVIGKACMEVIRDCDAAGHETGIHAWDHHHWQTHVSEMNQAAAKAELTRGITLFKDILGKDPDCYAAPAWRITEEALRALETFHFKYISVCRGDSIFRTSIKDQQLENINIPTTLPTYDELIGRDCTQESYNDFLLNMIKPDQLNVLTIHAEAEGISCLSLFEEFLKKARQRGIGFIPLGKLLTPSTEIVSSVIQNNNVKGRDGWISVQSSSDN